MTDHFLRVGNLPITAIDQAEAVDLVAGWASARVAAAVYFCNAHSLVEAHRSVEFRRAVDQAELCLPDGMPVAKLAGLSGGHSVSRVAGPDFMWEFCARHPAIPVFLYGSTPETLNALVCELRASFPSLRLVGAISPPFGAADSEHLESHLRQIGDSGAAIVWVGLGCPKQELLIARLKRECPAVFLGVGAAFDFHSKTMSRAPSWMRQLGVEWLHRLAKEPRRLVGRYSLCALMLLRVAAGLCFSRAMSNLRRIAA